MWWDGLFSLLADLFDPKDPRKKDGLWLFIIVAGVLALVLAPFGWLYFP